MSAGGVTPTADGTVVRTENGAIRGIARAEVQSYRGVPYAAPPTGEYRWRSPRPAPGWAGVRDATRPAGSCAQGEFPIAVPSTNEDCLYLDVTTPSRRSGQKPVVVWLHGGDFKYGANSLYGPDRLASRGDVVVVQPQYRLGVFGFLADPSLGKYAGNFGLEDQQAALRWVRRNAAAFGGDPRNVTIMGESAGGYSVCAHLTSPTSTGLFDRAIIQSAPCAQESTTSRADAQKFSSALATSFGMQHAAGLRSIGAKELLAATETAEFRPITGGPILPRDPSQSLRAGRLHRVPVLHGVNHDEETGRYGAQEVATGQPITQAAYELAIRDAFGTDASKIIAEYADVRPSGRALATVMTDANWSLPADRTNRLLAARTPTYTFEFSGDAPWYAGMPRPYWPTGSHHMSEVAYFFDLTMFEPPNERFADELIQRWTAFARSGNPNVSGTTYWRPATPTDRSVLSLAPSGTRRTDFTSDHRLTFWRSLGR
nr:carboxylesterase family protein [Kribbella italica]